MRRVLATAGHVDHGKSTLVRELTGRDPDRLAQERERGLTIELGFAWTRLPSGAEVAFVDVPGHQRFVGTMLAGLGPAPAVVLVVAADQGWQEQSSEHLAAVQALGICDGVLVISRCDLADDARRAAVRADASGRLAAAGLDLPVVEVAATAGLGLSELRDALDDLVARLPRPDPAAPVRLWGDRSFSVAGAGTVVTGTLGGGTIRTGEHLTLLEQGTSREVTVRGLHSQDSHRDQVGPVSRVAVNLRRTEGIGRSPVLLTPDAWELAAMLDVAVVPVGDDEGGDRHLPEQATMHVGSLDTSVHVRPLGEGLARLTSPAALPWQIGDRAILRDAGSRRLWAVRVLDVGPLPLTRRGAARQRGDALSCAAGSDALGALRLRSRAAERAEVLDRLGVDAPADACRVGEWLVDGDAMRQWRARLIASVDALHRTEPLSAGMPVAEAARRLDLPGHLPASLGADVVRQLVVGTHLTLTDGRVRDPQIGGLGHAEAGVSALEERLGSAPFAAPERGELAELGLGASELAAAARLGRLLRLPDDVVLLPDGPARAMRVLAQMEQPFTLSQARRALGTTRRVAVPLLEHLDSRGWTRRVDGNLRRVAR